MGEHTHTHRARSLRARESADRGMKLRQSSGGRDEEERFHLLLPFNMEISLAFECRMRYGKETGKREPRSREREILISWEGGEKGGGRKSVRECRMQIQSGNGEFASRRGHGGA